MMDQDVTAEESRKAMDTIIRRTKDFEDRGLEKEILTVDNHCDGVYMYLKALKNGDEKLAAQIKDFIAMNGGNRSGIAFAEVDPLGYVHPDQFTQHHTFGNVRERKFGDIWQDVSHPIMAVLKTESRFLRVAAADVSSWTTAMATSVPEQRLRLEISGNLIHHAILLMRK